jgi:outer membrane cobalamin receptor
LTDVLLGLRMDDNSVSGSRLSPRIGISRTLSARTRLRASYSEGFRAPSLVDMYYNNFGAMGDPNLRPEKSRQYEIGVNAQFGKNTLDVALFTSRVVDQIICDPTGPPENPWKTSRFINLDCATQQGIEVSWDRPLGDSLRLGMSYTYLDAMNLTDDTPLPGIPHNQIGLTLSAKFRGWDAALTGRYWDDRPYSTGIAQGAAVLDLTFTGQSTAPTNPYLVIRNLTDVSYEEDLGYPAAGRSIEVGMRSAW